MPPKRSSTGAASASSSVRKTASKAGPSRPSTGASRRKSFIDEDAMDEDDEEEGEDEEMDDDENEAEDDDEEDEETFPAAKPRKKPPTTTNGRASTGSTRQAADPWSSGKDTESVRIPPKLLTKLLHTSFEDDSTRIGKEANAAVGKYMETFVREAIARAKFERKDGFLEVEDLEKLAPQLLLDF